MKSWLQGLMKSAKCFGAGKKVWEIHKRKTAPFKSAEKTFFRREKTNSFFGFHWLSGLAQLLFNQEPSSLRLSLKTFGLPFESVLWNVSSMSLPFSLWINKRKWAVFYLWYKINQHESPSLSFFWQLNTSSAINRLDWAQPKSGRLHSQYIYAGKVLKSLNRSI